MLIWSPWMLTADFGLNASKNPKYADGKFYCRSGNPYNPELVIGKRGHVSTGSHLDAKKKTMEKVTKYGSPSKGFKALFHSKSPAKVSAKAALENSPPPPKEPEKAQDDASSPSGSNAAPAGIAILPSVKKTPPKCQGLGWDITDP